MLAETVLNIRMWVLIKKIHVVIRIIFQLRGDIVNKALF